MTRALLLAALLPGLALANDWRDIVAGPQSVWSVTGNVTTQSVRGVVTIVALVKRTTTEGAVQQFYAGVPLLHCDAARGELALQPTDGSAPIAGVWDRSSPAAAARLAIGLCAEFRRTRT